MLHSQLKPRSRARSSWVSRVRTARRTMEAAGVACAVVAADDFAPGIEHRRVLWAHSSSHNASLATRLLWASASVAALHSFHADGVVEFRDAASGRLVGFSLTAVQGAYAAATVYAARPEVARAGLWCAAAWR